MWLSYIKAAFRSLIKQRLYALINIASLAVGVTTCVLILIFVRYEQSFDKFHPKAERIFRLGLQGKMGDNEFSMGASAAPEGPTMKELFPEVLDYVRIRDADFPVRYEDKLFSENQWWLADSSIFDIFEIPFIAGDPKTALTQPYSVVLTERMAAKYFGNEDPLGKVLNTDNRDDYSVTGVVKEFPANSHWHFDFLSSMVTDADSRVSMWTNNNYSTYLLLEENSDYHDLLAKFPGVVKTYVGPEIEQYLGITMDQFEERGDAYRLLLEPMIDIHLNSQVDDGIENNGDGKMVAIFAYIALFILLLAVINYMNLSTARSMSRAREIGIRKTLGAKRGQIIVQFLAESVFVTLLSFSVAILMVKLLMPWFATFVDAPLAFSLSDIPFIFLWTIPVGLLAGSYPAFLLSSFNPIKVLKGNRSSGKGGGWLRNGLVIFQFAVSIILIIGTMIIKGQLDYMQTKDLGLNPENLIVVNKTGDIGSSIQTFKTALRQEPGALIVSNSSAIPGGTDALSASAFSMLKAEGETTRLLSWFWVDQDYADAYELRMKSGRFFSRDWGTDTNAVVINEAAVRSFGLSEPLGKELITYQGSGDDPRIMFKIIGIVEDYHFDGPQVEIEPMAMLLMSDEPSNTRATWGGYVSVRVDPNQNIDLLGNIEKSWKQIAGNQAFDYDHFEDVYAKLFVTERQSANIVILFAALAIFIATIGLLGLASFTAETRTKEIGIRKVLGASVANILVMLSKDTLKVVLVSAVIAIPIAHYAMQRWLENFAYRIDVSVSVFILAAVLAILVAIATVVWQSFRAATANPVKSLRYE